MVKIVIFFTALTEFLKKSTAAIISVRASVCVSVCVYVYTWVLGSNNV